MLAQEPRSTEIETAEVIEAKRPTADFVVFAGPLDVPSVGVPVCDVDGPIAKDVVIEQCRDEVDVALVDEAPLSVGDSTIPSQALLPPGEETARPGRHGDEPEVEVPESMIVCSLIPQPSFGIGSVA